MPTGEALTLFYTDVWGDQFPETLLFRTACWLIILHEIEVVNQERSWWRKLCEAKQFHKKVENVLDDPMVWMDVWKESRSDDLWSYLWGVILVMLMDERWSVRCEFHIPWTPVSSLQQWVTNWTVHSINNLAPKLPFPDSFITAAEEN